MEIQFEYGIYLFLIDWPVCTSTMKYSEEMVLLVCFFCLFFLEDERGTIEWEQLWLANFVTPRTKPKTKKASELFRMFWRRLRSSYSSDSDSKWSSSAPSPPPPTPPPCCCRHETSRICCASRCCFLHLMRRFWNHTFTWNDHQMRNHRTTD